MENALWDYAEEINKYSGWNKDFVFGSLLINVSRNLGKLVSVDNPKNLRPRTNLYAMLVAPPYIEQKSTLLDWEDRLSHEIQVAATDKLIELNRSAVHDPNDHTTQLIGSDLAIEDVLKQYKDVHFKHSEFGNILFAKQRMGRYDERNLSILNDGFYGLVSSHNFRQNSSEEVDDVYITALVDAHIGEINSGVLAIGLTRRFIIITKDFKDLIPEDKIKSFSLANAKALTDVENKYKQQIVEGLCKLVSAIQLRPDTETIEKDGVVTTVDTFVPVRTTITVTQDTLDAIIRNSLETYKRVKQEETLIYQHENDELVLRGAINLAVFDYAIGKSDELVVLPQHIMFMRDWLHSISDTLDKEVDTAQNYEFVDKLDRLAAVVTNYFNKYNKPISLGTLTNNLVWFKKLDFKERNRLINECIQREMFMGFIYHSTDKANLMREIFMPIQSYDDAETFLKQFNIVAQDAVSYSNKYVS
jgi:hypothetical protein